MYSRTLNRTEITKVTRYRYKTVKEQTMKNHNTKIMKSKRTEAILLAPQASLRNWFLIRINLIQKQLEMNARYYRK